jgi:sugar phosphate isomerase/epimerase
VGTDGVELLDFYWKDKEKELQEVIEALKKLNLPVSAYDITNNFVKSSSVERHQEIEKVKNGVRTAKQLGTNIVRVFAGDLSDEFTFDDAKKWIIEGLKSCAADAEKEEVYLALENHGLLAGKSEQVAEIIGKVGSPYVKATFDTGNFLLVHEDPKDAFKKLKDQIVHVHFKDFRKKRSNETLKGFRSVQGKELIGTVPGDGQVDLAYILQGLKDWHYDGWLSIEYEGFEDAQMANEKTVHRLRNLLI